MAYTDNEEAVIVFDALTRLCAVIEYQNEKVIERLFDRIAHPDSGFSPSFKDMLYGMVHLIQSGDAFDD